MTTVYIDGDNNAMFDRTERYNLYKWVDKLPWVKRCTRNKLVFWLTWLDMRVDLSRSFKVIDSYINWKLIYDFLLVINCHPSLILSVSEI